MGDAIFLHHILVFMTSCLAPSTKALRLFSHAESSRQSTDVSAAFHTDQEPNQGPLGLKIQGLTTKPTHPWETRRFPRYIYFKLDGATTTIRARRRALVEGELHE